MINDKKVDQTAKKISSMYVKGLTDIVDNLLKTKEGMTNKEFSSAIVGLNMQEIVKAKLSNIKTEYHNAHIEALKDIKPPVNND